MPVAESLITSLLAFAIQSSGLPSVDVRDLPPVLAVTETTLAELVCPDEVTRCRSIAALFDTEKYRILLRTSLDLNDPIHQSFLVHELVHVLQFKHFGETRFATCRAVLSSEHEAYAVQNAYLRNQGVDWQEGALLRYARCPADGG